MYRNVCGLRTMNATAFGLFVVLTACVSGCAQTDNQVDTFAVAVSEIEQRVGGVIGVYAVDTGTGTPLAYRADERFAMASTFKPLLVAAVLAKVDEGVLRLDEMLEVDRSKIVSYSPVVDGLPAGQTISVAELCAAAMTISDNTAANMLLELVDGPAGLTRFLRDHGDQVTRLDRNEVELNTNLRDDDRDTTTPHAMVESLRRFVLSDVLSADSRLQLQEWMVASRTGSKRLRAGFPAQWRVGDKTGSAMNGAVNNTAVAWPPGRSPIVIAVFQSWSDAPAATLGAVHAEIGGLVAARFGDPAR